MKSIALILTSLSSVAAFAQSSFYCAPASSRRPLIHLGYSQSATTRRPGAERFGAVNEGPVFPLGRTVRSLSFLAIGGDTLAAVISDGDLRPHNKPEDIKPVSDESGPVVAPTVWAAAQVGLPTVVCSEDPFPGATGTLLNLADIRQITRGCGVLGSGEIACLQLVGASDALTEITKPRIVILPNEPKLKETLVDWGVLTAAPEGPGQGTLLCNPQECSNIGQVRIDWRNFGAVAEEGTDRINYVTPSEGPLEGSTLIDWRVVGQKPDNEGSLVLLNSLGLDAPEIGTIVRISDKRPVHIGNSEGPGGSRPSGPVFPLATPQKEIGF